jgi:hypothetical protein
MAEDAQDANIEMDTANLYREESFTDRRVGNLQRLSPVTRDGQADESRTVLYIG